MGGLNTSFKANSKEFSLFIFTIVIPKCHPFQSPSLRMNEGTTKLNLNPFPFTPSLNFLANYFFKSKFQDEKIPSHIFQVKHGRI